MTGICHSKLGRLLEHVQLSGLLSAGDLSKVREAVLFASDFERDSDEFVDAFQAKLVAEGVLTEWQCRRLADGRWKGFLVDDCVILSHLSTQRDSVTYEAKHLSTQRIVKFIVMMQPFRYRIEFHDS